MSVENYFYLEHCDFLPLSAVVAAELLMLLTRFADIEYCAVNNINEPSAKLSVELIVLQFRSSPRAVAKYSL